MNSIRYCSFTLGLFLLSVVISYAQTPSTAWAHQFGEEFDDYANSIATDANGNTYTTGAFSGKMDFDPGPGVFEITSVNEQDAFILKLDQNGNFLWAKNMGGAGNGVTIDASGNVYTTGWFTDPGDFDPGAGTFTLTPAGHTDIFILKLDKDGIFIWAKSIGGTEYDEGKAIVTDATGNVYFTGYFQDVVDFDPGAATFNLTSAGNNDIFIAKLDNNGNFIWAKQVGGVNGDNANSIALDPSNNVLVTGGFRGSSIDFDPGTGTYPLSTTSGTYDVFILKLDNNGAFTWAVQIGGTGADTGNAITSDISGNVYVTGQFRSTVDFDPGTGTFNITSGGFDNMFVLKLDKDKNFTWAKNPGVTLYSSGNGIVVDASQNVFITGNFDDNESGGNIYVAQLDAGGNTIWDHTLGKTDDDSPGGSGLSIALDGSGNIYFAGGFNFTVDFGFGCIDERSAVGTFDIFIEKLTSNSSLTITSFSPTTGSAGIPVTITGTGFSLIPNNNIVFFNGEQAVVTSSTSTSLSTTVPINASTGPLTVSVGCPTVTSMVDFEVIDLTIDTQPSSALVCEGTTPSFSVDASGTTNIQYRWQKFNGSIYSDISNGSGYTGATISTLSVNTTGIFGAGNYRCKISGDFVTDKFSNTVTLSVNALPCLPPPAAPELAWAKNMTSAGDNVALAITTDGSGNIYTTGRFEGTVDFDPGPQSFNLTSNGGTDVFISKVDASGNFIWARSMGGSDYDYGSSITTDATGNVYTTGTFYVTSDFDPGSGDYSLISAGDGDIFISKLTSAGDFVWAKGVGNEGLDEGASLKTDVSGNVYITGHFGDLVDFDPGLGTHILSAAGGTNDYDIFILKLDNDGDFAWAKSMGDVGLDQGRAITVDASGNSYTTGQFEGTVDLDPGPSTFFLTAAGLQNSIFIVRLDGNGNFVWAENLGGDGDQNYGNAITTDVLGNVYTTGSFQGTGDFDPGPGVFNLASAGSSDVVISKLDASGNFIWAKSLGGVDYEEAYAISVDASGNIYSMGYFNGTADFDPGASTFNLSSNGDVDIFLFKLDTNGDFLWAANFGGASYDFGFGLTTDPLGNIYSTGFFQETADFNPGTCALTLDASKDGTVFIQKLTSSSSPCPAVTLQPGTQAACAGSTATFTTSATGVAVAYQWQKLNTTTSQFEDIVNNGGYSGVTTEALAVNTSGNFGAGDYRCKIAAANADPLFCSSATLNVNASPPAASVTGAAGCSAGAYTLTASGASNGQYRWYATLTGLSLIPGEVNNSYSPSVSVTTSFFVSINAGLCEGPRTEAKVVIDTPPAAPLVTNAAGCSAGMYTFTASGTSNGQYRWYTTLTGPSLIPGEVNSKYTTPLVSATASYFVSINTGICEGPRAEAMVVINTPPSKPVITSALLVGIVIEVCNTTAVLSAPSGYSAYMWSSGETTAQISTGVGKYTVSVTDNNGCTSPASDEVQVIVSTACLNSAPSIISSSHTTSVESTLQINLLDLISDQDNNLNVASLKIILQPSSGAIAVLDANGNLIIDYKGVSFSGTDHITIEVCDQLNACTQQVITIEVIGDIIVYNGISPNGDGKNDFFFLQYIDVLERTKNNKVMIFNRWGDVVFETENYDNITRVFRGLNKNGDVLPTGTYFYKIDFAASNGSKTGYLSLKN
jgi:gliding motility-associated-like protein